MKSFKRLRNISSSPLPLCEISRCASHTVVWHEYYEKPSLKRIYGSQLSGSQKLCWKRKLILRNAKCFAEVERFLPHRSGSALWFHLRSPGTGDRLIPFRHLPGRKCDVLFRSTSCDRNTDKRFLMGPWGDRDTSYQSESQHSLIINTHMLFRRRNCIRYCVPQALYSLLYT